MFNLFFLLLLVSYSKQGLSQCLVIQSCYCCLVLWSRNSGGDWDFVLWLFRAQSDQSVKIYKLPFSCSLVSLIKKSENGKLMRQDQSIKNNVPHYVDVLLQIDNLVKGASGQALQNLNLLMGFPENLGLHYLPLFPQSSCLVQLQLQIWSHSSTKILDGAEEIFSSYVFSFSRL